MRTLFGIPIEGNRNDLGDASPSLKILEFSEALFAVLQHDSIACVRWKQFIPLGKRGTVGNFCVFPPVIRLASDKDDSLEGTLRERGDLGGLSFSEDAADFFYNGPDEQRFNDLQRLDNIVSGHPYSSVMMDLFGNSTQVSVSRKKISLTPIPWQDAVFP